MMLTFELIRPGAKLPMAATTHSAGLDLFAAIDEPITLCPGQRRLVPSGIKAEIPYGYELQIRPRSGLAYKKGVTVLNAPGTIDADYKLEIGIILVNHGEQDFIIEPGMAIAQMVPAKVDYLDMNFAQRTGPGVGEVHCYSPIQEAERVGGFGSTS